MVKKMNKKQRDEANRRWFEENFKKSVFMVTAMRTPAKGTEVSERRRCWGWYPTYKEAVESVKVNDCDMYEEGYYDLIVIEAVPPYTLAMGSKQLAWYKWRTARDQKGSSFTVGKWVKCKQPAWAVGTCNFSIG
jgi:hypothetical protein